MAGPRPMRTEFGIHHRLESCVGSKGWDWSMGLIQDTTLQSMMNTKLSPHRFWPCHENGLIKTIQMIPHNQYVSFKLTSLYCGLRIILVYPNPQKREADLRLTCGLWDIVGIVLMSPFSWQCQNPCGLSLAFIIDWRVVGSL